MYPCKLPNFISANALERRFGASSRENGDVDIPKEIIDILGQLSIRQQEDVLRTARETLRDTNPDAEYVCNSGKELFEVLDWFPGSRDEWVTTSDEKSRARRLNGPSAVRLALPGLLLRRLSDSRLELTKFEQNNHPRKLPGESGSVQRAI
jgi:hypothetical protein